MNQVECPNCGWRDLHEFRYGGEVRPRPAVEETTPQEWTAYLYTRGNPAGYLQEWWYHRFGCGAWFTLLRHTNSHKIREARSRDEAQGMDPR